MKKFISTISLAIMAVIAASAFCVANAGFSHSDDNWKRGAKAGIFTVTQYSEFYCSKKQHRATVAYQYNGEESISYEKEEKPKGKWAKVSVNLEASNLIVRRSYYSHV